MWQYSIQKDPLMCKQHCKTRNKQAFRSNPLHMFYKIGVLENFEKIHRKIPVLKSLFNKVARLKSLHHNRFPGIFKKFSRTPWNTLLNENSLRLIYINYDTPEIIIQKSETIIQELREYYKLADEQGSLSIFSDYLVATPPLYAVKNFRAKKHFLITPWNQTTPERK